ncbi:MAG: hypothetical protein RMI89_02435 [Gloeomargarita sp. SKYBB_i_bin120]|nr:hypothetical protein [Gloeomargarita sp. SKYB120]MDW8177378.1 hypothetical protein [Gloeomargarita sp. SKYBB_i_bin120]
MNATVLRLLNTAEQRYLDAAEQQQLWQQLQGMSQRLAVYEQLRSQEAQIFRPVARQMPTVDEATATSVLRDWVGALRGAALAMVLDSPETFDQRVGQWLQSRPRHPLHATVAQLLEAQLKTVLGAQGWSLLSPYWEQARRCLSSH